MDNAFKLLVGYFVYSSNTSHPFRLALDLSGGTHLVYQADVSKLKPADIADSMTALRDDVERRVNIFGVSEPLVQTEQNATLSSAFGSPLAGRQAWSSNSVGFISTVVNLPAAAAGQTIQLEWLCATDSGNGPGTPTNGWYIDSIAINGAACCANAATAMRNASRILIW